MADFVEAITREHGEVYIVGGAVRNAMFNRFHGTTLLIKDRDLLVRGVAPARLKELLDGHGTVKEVGQKFGVLKFRRAGQGTEFDVALPRTEVSTGPGYKDFKIVPDHTLSLEEDFRRRDATINAMGVRIAGADELGRDSFDEAEVIDPFSGLVDLRRRIWRSVGDPTARFVEDPTRIMRALRQCAEMGLELEQTTRRSIVENYRLLGEIIQESVVRVTEELVRLLLAPCRARRAMVDFLFDSGVAEFLEIPSQGRDPLLRCDDSNSNLRVRIACLLTGPGDAVGWCRKYELSACPHFPSRDVNFLKCVASIPVSEIDVNDDVAMRRLIQSAEKLCPNHGVDYTLDLIRYHAIVTASPESGIRLRDLHQKNHDTILTIAQVKLDGNTIRELYGLTGNGIKDLKTRLFDAITEGHVENVKDKLIEYVDERALIRK